jgi:hypothetical protein
MRKASPASGWRCSKRSRPPSHGSPSSLTRGNLKGVGRIYQQTFIDTYTKVSFAKLYDRKTPITAGEARPHQGRWCFGKTPMLTFLDAMPMTKEKMIAA